jgi:hypothetical protein
MWVGRGRRLQGSQIQRPAGDGLRGAVPQFPPARTLLTERLRAHLLLKSPLPILASEAPPTSGFLSRSLRATCGATGLAARFAPVQTASIDSLAFGHACR